MKYAAVILMALGLAQGGLLPATRLIGTELLHGAIGYSSPGLISTSYAAAPSVFAAGPAVVTSQIASAPYIASAPLVSHTPIVTSHIAAAPAIVGTHFGAAPAIFGAPAVIGPVAAIGEITAPIETPAPEAAAPEEAPAPVEVEAPAEAEAPASDDTAVIDAAVIDAAVMDAAPEEAPAPAEEAAPAEPEAPAADLPGPIPIAVEDTPEVAQARLAHLAAVENAKIRNAYIESSQKVIASSFVPAAPYIAHHAPAVFAAPAITRTVLPSAAYVHAPSPVAYAHAPAVVAPAPIPAPIAAPIHAHIAHAPVAAPLSIASQYHSQDELGQFSYGYAGGPSTKEEIRTFDGVTRGGYSYVDANGLVQHTSYVSDPVHGFRVSASNLPVQPAPVYLDDTPEVAAAKAEFLKIKAEHEAKITADS